MQKLTLSKDDWQNQINKHQFILKPYLEPHLQRRHAGIKHPVYDFLFDYYPFRPAQLNYWTPGIMVILEHAVFTNSFWQRYGKKVGTGLEMNLAKFPRTRLPFLIWGKNYLIETQKRAPFWGCFGLHEWAMLYNSQQPKHPQLQMRVSPKILEEVILKYTLVCTHFDAYRFFTPQSIPLNRYSLSRDSSVEFDQSGCLHVNMDLYKMAFKLYPWCSSELIREAFELAWFGREIDMRASPYDLRDFGFEPIEIETETGLQDYLRMQQEIHSRGKPIRGRLINLYSILIETINKSNPIGMTISLSQIGD